MDGLLMIAMNKHREICSIQSSGGIMLLKEQVGLVEDKRLLSRVVSKTPLACPEEFTLVSLEGGRIYHMLTLFWHLRL